MGDIMSIPALPPFYNMRYTNPQGNLTPGAHLFNDQVYQTLTALIGHGYLAIPQATAAQIAASLTTAPVGAIWFNTTSGMWQGLQAPGILKTFTVT